MPRVVKHFEITTHFLSLQNAICCKCYLWNTIFGRTYLQNCRSKCQFTLSWKQKNSQRPWVQNTHYPQCGSARVFWPDTFKGAPQKLFDGFVSIRWGKYPKILPYVFRGQSWGLALRTWVPIQILPLFRQNIGQMDSEGLLLWVGVGDIIEKIIESRYIGHFLIIGQIIVIDFTLP